VSEIYIISSPYPECSGLVCRPGWLIKSVQAWKCWNQSTEMRKTMQIQQGIEKLREELNWLQQIERPSKIEAIRDARDSPDFQESAQYMQILEEQQIIEQHIGVLESKLSNAEIVDVERTDEIR
jgi:hypothetical protein